MFHPREMIAKTRKLPNMWRKQDFLPRSQQKNHHLKINLKGLEVELDLVQEAMFHQQPLFRDNHHSALVDQDLAGSKARDHLRQRQHLS